MAEKAEAGPAAAVPEWAWAPAVAGILTLAVGLIALAAGGQTWLFPSLGPTIYLQARKPTQESARPYHVVAGHAIAVAAALIGVLITGARHAPSSVLGDGVLAPERVWASGIAMVLLVAGEIAVRAGHPPAAATAQLITLGGFKIAWHDLAAIAAGVLTVAVLGEIARRLRAPAARP